MVCIKLMINDRHIKEFQVHYDLWLIVVGCRFESNCPLVGPGIIGGMLSVGVFLRDPNPYLREFWRKPRKTQYG